MAFRPMGADVNQSPRSILIAYDGDCPFCSSYIRWMRLKSTVGSVELVDCRDRPDLVESYCKRGYDVNDGMIVEFGDQIYYGADAVWLLANLSSRVTLWNKFNQLVFSSRALSAALYPALKLGRLVTLRLLGRSLIPTPER